MPADEPYALLLTWTCYGTWLPGDRRGYVSNTLQPDGGFLTKQNRPGTPYTANEPYTLLRAKKLQKRATAHLTRDIARCAAYAFAKTSSVRRWRILRGAVMSNHVHLLITNCPDDGPAVRRILKGVSQAAMSKQHGHPQRWWTQGGSDRYLHEECAILAAHRYVEKQKRMLVGIDDMRVYIPA